MPSHTFIDQLRPKHKYFGPVLILNAAVNYRDTSRRAGHRVSNFAFCPLTCGYSVRKNERADYITSDYFYAEEKGVRLAAAMALSGSAVSTNMGFKSSRWGRIFHGLFNLRLGWWFCNLGHPRAWNEELPRARASLMMGELFGTPSIDRPYIHLSDCGHFENLGL